MRQELILNRVTELKLYVIGLRSFLVADFIWIAVLMMRSGFYFRGGLNAN